MGLTASFFCTFTRFVGTTESVRVGEKPSNSLQIRRVGTSERAQTVEDGLEAFRQAFGDAVSFPCDGFVIGEPVSIVEIGYAGNVRRGLTATCRRKTGPYMSSLFWMW